MPLRRSPPVAIVYVVAFAWLMAKAALFRERVPPSVPPDELAHVSYVAYLDDTGCPVPRYEEMRLLDDAGRFCPLPNYLPHPALYYAAIGGLDRLGGGERGAPLDALTRRLRRASAPLFAAAAALFLFLGWRRTAPLAEHVVYAAAVATVPPLAFVGAAVNNDVLSFLSGGIVLLGLVRWLEGRVGVLTAILVGAGLSLAILSKVTAGLLVTLAVLGTFALAHRVSPPGRNGRFALAFIPWLVLPALHFVPVLLRYGTPIPSLDVVDPEAFARSAFVVAPAAVPMSLAAWGAKAAKTLASTWLSITGHVWLPVGPVWTLAGPALLLALAALGIFASARLGSEDDRSGRALARIGAGAFAVTLFVNLVYAYAAYSDTGRFGGIHARYYLVLLPCVGLAVAAAFRRLAAGPWLAAALAALLVLADASVTVRTFALFRG